MVNYYPILLNIDHRPCLVVGGGSVGTRKVEGLLASGAIVTVISLRLSQKLTALKNEGKITVKIRSYQSSDLDHMFLVIGATDDEKLHHQIKEDAEKRQMLCNIADRPKACNFILPSIIRQKDLIIAISTSGASPAFAKFLRKKLRRSFGPEYEKFLTLMKAIRKKLLAQAHAPEEHKPLFEKLIHSELIQFLKVSDVKNIDTVLKDVLGEGFSYDTLIGTDNDENIKRQG